MPIKYYLQLNPVTPDPKDCSARIEPRDTLTEQEITKLMLKRGTMVTETDILAILQLFFDVVGDAVADGSHVNLPIAYIRPAVRGVFKDINDTFDASRHRKEAALSVGPLLKEKLRTARLEKIPNALPSPVLSLFEDVNSGTTDSVVTPGSIGRITGSDLKFDPTQEDEGIFFIKDGEVTRVSVIALLTEGRLMFMIPSLDAGDYTLEVRRAYTTSRSIRTGSLDQTLTVGEPVETT